MSFRPTKPREPGSTKAIVAALLHAAGGPKKIADHFRLSETVVHSWSDPGEDAEIWLARARALVDMSGSTVLAEAMAADVGGWFMPGEPSQEALDVLMGREELEHGRLICNLMKRLAANDGRPDPKLAAEFQIVISALAAAMKKVAP